MYYGNPVAHNLGLMTHALPFARALRTRNVYSASSADQLPQMLAALRMFGHLALHSRCPISIAPIYFLIFGANPVVSNGSLMTAPTCKGRLRAIRDRGGRIVVVDPRRTETAEIADEHVAIRPGTDALLLAAMLHVVFAEGMDAAGPPRRPGEERRCPRRLRPRAVAGARRAPNGRRRGHHAPARAASSRARRGRRVTGGSGSARSATGRSPRGWCRRSISSPVISTRSGA